jgi:hypothetical protein
MGVSEYSEDLLARIDFPQLEILFIHWWLHHVVFDSDIRQVIHHSRMLGPFSNAEVTVLNKFHSVGIQFYRPEGTNPPKKVELEIHGKGPGWHYPSITQLCNRSLSLLSSVPELTILTDDFLVHAPASLDHIGWPELFYLLTGVRTLRLSGGAASRILYWLEGLTGESVTDVLPALRNLYVDEHALCPGCAIDFQQQQNFVAARQHFGQPVTVYLE